MDTDILYQRARIVLAELEEIFLQTISFPNTDANAFYPLDEFYHNEFSTYRHTLEIIQEDIAVFRACVDGVMPATSEISALISTLCSQNVPHHWLQYDRGSSCSTLTTWARRLMTRMINLISYYDASTSNSLVIYHLDTFVRPASFLQSYLLNDARKNFRDVQSLAWDAQVSLTCVWSNFSFAFNIYYLLEVKYIHQCFSLPIQYDICSFY